jgi:dephospho-CoA kinase
MYKVGITGGIGSGKSTVAAIFAELDIPIYYADKEAKRLMNYAKPLKTQIRNLLGIEAYHPNGRLNRAYVASRVFNNKSLLSQLNSIVHPAVRLDFDRWSTEQKSPYVIEESALIFEIKGQGFFDATILVVADKNLRIERILKRDKTSKKAIISRMQNQLSDEIKIPLADYIINNNDGDDLISQVNHIHKEITIKI